MSLEFLIANYINISNWYQLKILIIYYVRYTNVFRMGTIPNF